jgi:hypothetical protein
MAITFNISYGSGVPAAAQTVVTNVVNYFASQFNDAVSLNFTVNWGSIGGLGASSYSLFTYTYGQVTGALSSDSKTSDDATTVASLAASDPISGTHSWTMVRAEAKALGLIAGTATGSDGSMTFSNSAAFDFDNSNGVTSGQYDFYGVVAHELSELMGREVNAIGNNVATGAGYHPLDLFKYSGTGAHVFAGTTPGYFSVNNGTTNLANFNTNPNGDFGDWASGINDSFLAFSNSGVINPVSQFDLREMDVIGWDRVGVDDFPADATTTGVVPASGTATGNIEVGGDHDWFRVQLTAGVQYTLKLQGDSVGAGTLHDPFMQLFDGSSQFITSNDDGGGNLNSLIVYTPSASGTYYIDAGGFNNAYAGTYQIIVEAPVFAPLSFQLAAFAPGAGGWSSQHQYPRAVADVNGDGMADLVGFAAGGVNVSLATGGGHFAAPTGEIGAFGFSAGGWSSQDLYPRLLGDVNGDGKADIVGFASGGVLVSLATGNGHFATPTGETGNFGFSAGGWTSEDRYPRLLADVNGDGKADIVGFADGGVLVSLATGNGHFAAPTGETGNFGFTAGGWTSEDRYPRLLADVNGDHMADIVGFADGGVLVALATGNGHFAAPTGETGNFGFNAGGWTSQSLYPRLLADVNADGMADIVGFGSGGVLVALATGNGHFATPTSEIGNFGTNAGGWVSQDLYPRSLGDVDGDGRADIIGFGQAGIYEALANSFHLV